MARSKSRMDHDDLVRFIYDYLLRRGFADVRADLPELARPDKIAWNDIDEGNAPDVTTAIPFFNIFEVETEDSIFDQHTEKRWRLFASYARDHNAKFHVVVPSGSGDSAEQRLKDLGILAQLLEVKTK